MRLKKLLMEVLTERLAGVSWLEAGALLTRDTADTELDLGKGRSSQSNHSREQSAASLCLPPLEAQILYI